MAQLAAEEQAKAVREKLDEETKARETAGQEEPESVPIKPGRKNKTVKTLAVLSEAGDCWCHNGRH
jgi:hypothetical protein